MYYLAAMDWTSWTFGLLSALVVLGAGKLVDYMRSEHKHEVDSAEILGELRAGIAGVIVRLAALENRMSVLESRIDAEIREHNKLFHAHRG